MKKVLIAGMTLAGAIGVFAQGSLVFNSDAIANPLVAGVNVSFHVYSPDVNTPNVEFTGNIGTVYSGTTRSGDFPTGTQTYTGTLIGGSTVGTGPTGWANGNNYSGDLIAAAGDNQPLSSLVYVAGSTETFKTSVNGTGFINEPSGALPIPGTTFSGSGVTGVPTSASVVVQAWYNGGGAYPTYASAFAAGVPTGQGAEFNVDGLGGGTITPPNLYNAQSFSLTTQIPAGGMLASPER